MTQGPRHLSLTFLGATGTVTGSKYLLDTGDCQVLVDCGLFQGYKQLRLRNWAPLPLAPAALDAVVLTHAHLDHSGALPLLVRQGFRARAFCTRETAMLCKILLPDSGRLQELDAEYANREGFSRHHPARPLYTEEDAMYALKRLKSIDFREEFQIAHGLTGAYTPAGHILGAASLRVSGDGLPSVVFSGDLGRQNDLMMDPPAPRPAAEYVVIESTYGDRTHRTEGPDDVLLEVIRRTARRGGVVVIPAFAVGRAQALLVLLDRMRRRGQIPDLPIYLDSPMASAVTELYGEHLSAQKLSGEELRTALRVAQPIDTSEESRAIDLRGGPAIIVSASGMATGGRVLHHLKRFLPDENSAVVLAGFQAGGTRGAALARGASYIKIHGRHVPVRAEVVQLDSLSAHADREELLAWLASGPPPRQVFITHGEPDAAEGLRMAIQERLGWSCAIPEYRQTCELG